MFCESCGKRMNDNSRFCKYCGMPVLDALEKEIPNRNHYLQCRNCANELVEDALFCDQCGTAVELKKDCNVCGRKIEKISMFCDICGSKQ